MGYLIKALIGFLLVSTLCVTVANATTINYTATSLGANQWRYDYSVTNDALAVSLEEFTIFFDESLYGQLFNVQAPAGWDPLLIEPDSQIPASGFFDVLAVGEGIAPGASLGGFAISFGYLGAGTPGAQLFSIIDPVTFAEIDAGLTQGPAAIPLPATGWLLLLGGFAFILAPRYCLKNPSLSGVV